MGKCRENLAILPYMCTLQYRYVRRDARAFLNHHVLVYRDKRLYHHIVSHLRFGMNVC